MRPAPLLLFALSGCIFGIPSEGKVDCTEACEITLNGEIVRADSVTSLPRSYVSVTLTSVPSSEAPKTQSDADGSYTLAGLAENTALEVELSFPQENPTVQSGVLVTRHLAGNATGDRTLDLPVVEFRWLAKVAFECGLFPTLDDAIFQPGTDSVNFYFIARSTIIGQVLNGDGSPASLNRSDITVSLGGYTNSHLNPADDTFPPPATVCFIEPDEATGTYKGVNADRSSSGRFVMFRARDAGGTGVGLAEVRLAGYPIGRVNLRSSGSVGFVRIVQGEGEEPLAPRPRTFEADVYPMLTDVGCVACHVPGGPGFAAAPVRDGFPADFSGTVEQVYDVLTKAAAPGCANGGAAAARVCLAKPEASLFFTKPRLETGQEPSDHQGIAFPDGSNVLLVIRDWIENGAPLR